VQEEEREGRRKGKEVKKKRTLYASIPETGPEYDPDIYIYNIAKAVNRFLTYLTFSFV